MPLIPALGNLLGQHRDVGWDGGSPHSSREQEEARNLWSIRACSELMEKLIFLIVTPTGLRLELLPRPTCRSQHGLSPA